MTTTGTPVVITGPSPVLIGSSFLTPPAVQFMSGTGANNSGGVGREEATGYQNNVIRIDGFITDLSQAGFTANGALAATLAASTAITLDMTNPGATQSGATVFNQKGDSLAAALNILIIANTGTSTFTVSAGASNALTGVPTYLVQPGTFQRLDFGATGLTVSSTAKTIKLDPGSNTPTFALAYGGS